MKIRISKEVLPSLPLVEVSSKEKIGVFFRKLGKKRGESCQIRLVSEKTEDSKHLLESAVCALYDGAYQFRKETLKKLDRNSIYEMRDLLTDFGETEYTFITEQISEEEGMEQIQRGICLGKAKGYARMLGDLPNNYLHTEEMVTYAEKVAKDCKMTCRVLEDRELKEMGAGGILAVNQGSRREAAMVVLEYEGACGEEKIGLVGKGLMFDAGGYHLKSIDGMNGMKYDMCGAASVFGTIKAIAELNLPLNVIGVLAGCENLPDGNAYRPGDILTTMNGLTVEVLNTDAEGRLVLCDALTYVERFEPQYVIDVATLTGACVVALGQHNSGLVSTDDALAEQLLQAAQQTTDKAWRLPLSEEYQEQLKSPFADLANIGGRWGGAITAGAFLSNFTKKYTWAHLDIAGTAWLQGANKGATGRPVSLLTQFLINQTK